ncbi:deoxynucleoside kinase [Thauera sp. CAU 1555]|jgi:deoxyadenosine/deoxycytidine kinase|uniref:Deoxynucleoside kinase n=1 Tax=Thauera sedimentorum TaxID=2767595 RepID=A0ABR9B6Z5_9RHOO|nr:deoxynucleoside kinase [Thauera sedimentorum]MBC9071128.1 deoxynucleoside kinase [Thauera sedimentorum]MBD8502047.1 deoxynucleoside kinase [Thauera sedimentorum]
MLDKARYIVVEGPIGAGKSSLARRLAERLPAETLFEQPEANPFLGRFYQSMDRWALATQVSFLFQRIDQLAEFVAGDPERRVVSDFILQKDPLFAALNLPADELAIYQRIYDTMMPPAPPKPDLVIYLQARPETLMERIRRRGMDAERRISESYVQRVAERFAQFFYQYDAAPLFIVDAEVLNPVDRDDDFELLLDRLRNMRSYREFFAYAG